MTRLAPDRLPRGVALPGYDRATRGIGIVHFGLGAFTRAHQAWYTDAAMTQGGGDWMIAGVSLRSPAVAAQLNPQGGLYTVATRSGEGTQLRVVGSIAEVIVAPEAPARIVDRLAAPGTAMVTFTVTEAGYCRAPDGSLDPALAGPGSFYPLLAEGLARRRAAGLGGVTLLSCDNLADNGRQLERLLGAHLRAHDPALADWVASQCGFPNAMVDRIVPAVTDADRAMVAAAIGMDDAAAVVTEPFSQWVIENRFVRARPEWEAAGAQIVADVTPFETAKLRMLNGAHSLLAYAGLAAGHAHVHAAIGDAALRARVEALMREEAAPTIAAAPGQDLDAYADALIERFANPALNHRLAQIAMDGSQKLPQRWLATLAENRRMGRRCPAILGGIGAWLRHVRGDNGAVGDPLADRLAACWAAAGEAGIVDAVFGPAGVLASAWVPDAEDRATIASALRVTMPA